MLFKNFNKLNFNIKFISNPDGIFRKFCSTLAKYSYGMYLTHVAFLSIAWYFLPRKPFMLSVTILLLVSIFIPLGILAVLNRIPYVNQVIGAK